MRQLFEMLQDRRFLNELEKSLDESDRDKLVRFTSLEELRRGVCTGLGGLRWKE